MRKSIFVTIMAFVLSLFSTAVFSAPQEYGKVAIVAKSGGGYTDPVTAMNNLATWCGIPSSANPCLLKIMPGVYDIDTNILQMQSYVDVEGSGENATKITGDVSAGYTGVVIAVSNSEVRFLTIENRSLDNVNQPAVLSINNDSPRITNITVQASGIAYNNIGIFAHNSNAIISNITVTSVAIGVQLNGAGSPKLNNVTITGADRAVLNTGPTSVITGLSVTDCNTGIHSFYAMPAVTDSTIMATTTGIVNSAGGGIVLKNVNVAAPTGVKNDSFGGGAGSVFIDHSEITSPGHTLYIEFGSVFVADTKLNGLAFRNSGISCKYMGVYDGNYDPISCPPQ